MSNAKDISVEQKWFYFTHSWEVIRTFAKDINQKENVVAWLSFEFAYYYLAVQHFSYCATETPLSASKYLSVWSICLIRLNMGNVFQILLVSKFTECQATVVCESQQMLQSKKKKKLNEDFQLLFYPLRVFHMTFNKLLLTEFWMTASLPSSPGLF